jgi:hypothetical protein
MRWVLVVMLAIATLVHASTAGEWAPGTWAGENTVELRTTAPGSEPHWFPVWLVVIDGQLYVRLGSRAAARFDENVSKPVVGVRIAGKTFDSVRAVIAPGMTDKVTAAMADKYWLQGDVIVRRMNHPYTVLLVPAEQAGD